MDKIAIYNKLNIAKGFIHVLQNREQIVTTTLSYHLQDNKSREDRQLQQYISLQDGGSLGDTNLGTQKLNLRARQWFSEQVNELNMNTMNSAMSNCVTDKMKINCYVFLSRAKNRIGT